MTDKKLLKIESSIGMPSIPGWIRKSLRELVAENKRLRDELQWYSTKARVVDGRGKRLFDADLGGRARRALNQNIAVDKPETKE